jgi:energy-coupling factor transporter ATP-binding protein EcfA2
MLNLRSTSRETLHHYQAFGTTIGSVLPLPLPPAAVTEPEIEIVQSVVPERLDGATRRGIRYQARPTEVLLEVEGVARYWIVAGRRIGVQWANGAAEDEVRLFLTGSAFGALLQQRGMLVLHGSAVVREGAAVAFLGGSGSGKSTLAVAFAQRGQPLLTDDVCVISPAEHGLLEVQAGFREARLWLDSLQQLQLAASDLRPARHNLQKRVLPLDGLAAAAAVPLRRIYVLQTSNRREIVIERLTGAEKFRTLRHHTYRLQFAAALGLLPTQFQQTLQLAQQAEVALVRRPLGELRVRELLERIDADCRA